MRETRADPKQCVSVGGGGDVLCRSHQLGCFDGRAFPVGHLRVLRPAYLYHPVSLGGEEPATIGLTIAKHCNVVHAGGTGCSDQPVVLHDGCPVDGKPRTWNTQDWGLTVSQVGGLIAYGVSHIKDAPVFSWQVLFMVLGLATVLWSIVIACFLPDSPMKAKCYNEDDKRLMFARVRGNQTGMQNKTYKRYQVIEALLDPYVWCCVLLQITSTLIIGGLGVFSNLIIKSLGFSVLQTQLLNIAQGAVTILVMVGGAMLASKTKKTLLVMFVSLDLREWRQS